MMAFHLDGEGSGLPCQLLCRNLCSALDAASPSVHTRVYQDVRGCLGHQLKQHGRSTNINVPGLMHGLQSLHTAYLGPRLGREKVNIC